ncbi:hypothetical protein VTK73DRAFT_928 [Phialemonium thermophilum]|uniref:Uncharacterized protein n=1 Tax=Phialemonium thermophilum TaxID=223376 RepID=A0ABR3VU75_9PEZI
MEGKRSTNRNRVSKWCHRRKAEKVQPTGEGLPFLKFPTGIARQRSNGCLLLWDELFRQLSGSESHPPSDGGDVPDESRSDWWHLNRPIYVGRSSRRNSLKLLPWVSLVLVFAPRWTWIETRFDQDKERERERETEIRTWKSRSLIGRGYVNFPPIL